MSPRLSLAAALVLAATTACTSSPPTATPKGGPRGLRATEHLEVAHQQDELARQDASFPAPHAMQPGGFDRDGAGQPWARSWDTHTDHERFARIHRSEAAAIQAEFDEACRGKTLAEISVSPLQRYGIGGTNTATGVVFYLSPKAGSPDALLADMRCHRAWMMLAPPAGMESCPLDMPDIAVDAHGDLDGIVVTIREPHADLVPELQRRAAHDLEAGMERPMQKPAP